MIQKSEGDCKQGDAAWTPSNQIEADFKFMQEHTKRTDDESNILRQQTKAFELVLGNAILTWPKTVEFARIFANHLIDFLKKMDQKPVTEATIFSMSHLLAQRPTYAISLT